MRIIISLVLLILCTKGISQVKVRGYFRKNGTYVQPHIRSKPDGNPYNNYSYQGNNNSSPFISNSNKSESSSKRSSPPPSIYKYKGVVKAGFNPPLRETPSINAKELYQCIVGEEVYVLDNTQELYYKVDVNGRVGYLSKSFIGEVSQDLNVNPQSAVSSVKNEKNLVFKYDDAYVPQSNTYQYKTIINASYEPPLRDTPFINGKVIYSCPINAKIYVIEKGKLYYKVNISGYIGYLSRSYIKDN